MFDPDNIDPDYVSFVWGSYTCRSEPSAEDYLDFARQELVNGYSERTLINALSHAKRALHLRMEDVCQAFGGTSLTKNKPFPVLASYLKQCGLPSLGALEKLNSARNAIEHKYTVPEPEMVEIYIDVAHFFIFATDRWAGRHPCDIETSEKNEAADRHLRNVSFDWKNGSVTLQISDKNSGAYEYPHSITYTNKQPEFFKWVVFATKHST
ncbi:hypothetical protein QLG06_04915 [Pseudomonas sp. V104_6]|uniref:hypothetical protein n=1 Tax=Pseudomonas sp. V104_6 TaxID=3044230 RepID=UPI00249DFDA7|nr:hypothetical protein [Pseudomonas sp. V104_6]MDI3373695.1 hypothetical protein [Pseudomonas sp. V104_6]